MTRTSQWISEGAPITVTTTQNAGESLAAFRARHEAKVSEALALFPPDDNSAARASVWTSIGVPQSTYTTRSAGQSWAAFAAAHDARNDSELAEKPADLVSV